MTTKTKETEATFDLASIGVTITKPRKADDHFSMLLFGEPKVGKTLLAGTAAEVEALSPVLVIAMEDGTSVLARDYGNDDNLDVAEIEDWPTAAALIQAVADRKLPYRTVVIDTVGEMMEQMKRHLTQSGDMRIQDWGTLADNTANVVKLLHRSGVNSILISHSEKTKDESTGAVTVSPFFLGKKSLGEVPKVVDIIAYLAVAKDPSTKEMVRVLQTGTDGKITAGDRFGKLDPQIVNPNFAEVWAQLHADAA